LLRGCPVGRLVILFVVVLLVALAVVVVVVVAYTSCSINREFEA
jgi:hypothetical protein